MRGAFAILFGLGALLLPLATIQALVLLFAAYMLTGGVFAVVASVRAAARHERTTAGVVRCACPGVWWHDDER